MWTHHYVDSAEECGEEPAFGWEDEGITTCSPAAMFLSFKIYTIKDIL